MTKRVTRIIGLIGIGLASLDAVGAPRDSTVEINGIKLSAAEWISVQTRLNTRIAPGRYLVDPRSGCWLNIRSGWTSCIGDPDIYPSQDSNGENHQKIEKDYSSNVPSQATRVTSDSIDHMSNWSSR